MSLSFPDGPMVGPPRALLYLAGVARDFAEVEVRILDALAEPDLAHLETAERPVLFGLDADEVGTRAAEWGADVVGVTTMANYYHRETVELGHALRAALPDATLLLGGADPTVDAEVYLDEAPFDAVCIGEGEQTFAELLGCLVAGRSFAHVPGLALRTESGTERTPPRAFVASPQSGADFSPLNLERYFELNRRGWRSRPTFLRPGVERSVDVITSRGCPFRCSFCVIHASMGRRFRTRSAAAVVEQLRVLVERGVQHVHFEDDIFNLDRARFVELLRALVAADLPLTWDTPNGVRADMLDAETVQLCRDTGCVYLIFGVESGNQRVLDEVVHKELQIEAVTEAARLCDQAKLDTFAFYIVGMPGETLAEAEQTVHYAFELFDRFGTTPLLQIWRPYEQTTLRDRAEALDLLKPADPAALHAETGIPYTQFRDRVATGAEIGVQELTALFDGYRRRLVAGQLSRWRRAGLRPPGDLTSPGGVEHFVLAEAPYLHARRRWDQG